MSLRTVPINYTDPFEVLGLKGGLGISAGDLRNRSIKVDKCPICGSSVLPGNNSLLRGFGYSGVKDGHAYFCHNLKVTFCDECLTGVGGVDIICKVIEASSTLRTHVENDCESLLNARRLRHRKTAVKWGVGLGIFAAVIGICCLIWKPEVVFIVIGVIAGFLIIGFLQGATQR